MVHSGVGIRTMNIEFTCLAFFVTKFTDFENVNALTMFLTIQKVVLCLKSPLPTQLRDKTHTTQAQLRGRKILPSQGVVTINRPNAAAITSLECHASKPSLTSLNASMKPPNMLSAPIAAVLFIKTRSWHYRQSSSTLRPRIQISSAGMARTIPRTPSICPLEESGVSYLRPVR